MGRSVMHQIAWVKANVSALTVERQVQNKAKPSSAFRQDAAAARAMADATERLLENQTASLRKQIARDTRSASKDIAQLTHDTDYLCTFEARHVAHAISDMETAHNARAKHLLERRDAEENMTKRVLSLEHEAS